MFGVWNSEWNITKTIISFQYFSVVSAICRIFLNFFFYCSFISSMFPCLSHVWSFVPQCNFVAGLACLFLCPSHGCTWLVDFCWALTFSSSSWGHSRCWWSLTSWGCCLSWCSRWWAGDVEIKILAENPKLIPLNPELISLNPGFVCSTCCQEFIF